MTGQHLTIRRRRASTHRFVLAEIHRQRGLEHQAPPGRQRGDEPLAPPGGTETHLFVRWVCSKTSHLPSSKWDFVHGGIHTGSGTRAHGHCVARTHVGTHVVLLYRHVNWQIAHAHGTRNSSRHLESAPARPADRAPSCHG